MPHPNLIIVRPLTAFGRSLHTGRFKEAVIWYADLLRDSYLAQGTGPRWTERQQFMPIIGVPKNRSQGLDHPF